MITGSGHAYCQGQARTGSVVAAWPTLSRRVCGNFTPRESSRNASCCARRRCCREGSSLQPSFADAEVPASKCDSKRSMSCCCSEAGSLAAFPAARTSLASDSICLAWSVDCMPLSAGKQAWAYQLIALYMLSTCTVHRSLVCWANSGPAGSKADIQQVKDDCLQEGQDAKGTASPAAVASCGLCWGFLQNKSVLPQPQPPVTHSHVTDRLCLATFTECRSASLSGQGSSPQAALSKLLAGESLHFSHCTLVATHVAGSLALHRVVQHVPLLLPKDTKG